MIFFKKSSQQLGNMEFGLIKSGIKRNEVNYYNNLSKQILIKILNGSIFK